MAETITWQISLSRSSNRSWTHFPCGVLEGLSFLQPADARICKLTRGPSPTGSGRPGLCLNTRSKWQQPPSAEHLSCPGHIARSSRPVAPQSRQDDPCSAGASRGVLSKAFWLVVTGWLWWRVSHMPWTGHYHLPQRERLKPLLTVSALGLLRAPWWSWPDVLLGRVGATSQWPASPSVSIWRLREWCEPHAPAFLSLRLNCLTSVPRSEYSLPLLKGELKLKFLP